VISIIMYAYLFRFSDLRLLRKLILIFIMITHLRKVKTYLLPSKLFFFTPWVVNKVVIINNVVLFVTLGSKCFFYTQLTRVWYNLGRVRCRIRILVSKTLLFKMWKKSHANLTTSFHELQSTNFSTHYCRVQT